MTLEALDCPLIVRVNGMRVSLRPGVPMALTDTQGLKLLARAPGRVRLVSRPTTLTVGAMATWESPLFGMLSGRVLEVFDHGVTVYHPLTEVPCTIPLGWLR